VNEKRTIEEKGRAERDGFESIMEIESEGALDPERPAPPELIDRILERLSEERNAQHLHRPPPDEQLQVLETPQTFTPCVSQGGSEGDPAALTAALIEVDRLLPLLARPTPPGLVEQVLANLAAEREAALAEVDQLLPLLGVEKKPTRHIALQRWCAFIGAAALTVTIAFIIAMASGVFGHDAASEKAAVTTQHAMTSMHYPDSVHSWLTYTKYAKAAAIASAFLAATLLGVLTGLIAVRRSIMSRVLRRIGADQVQPSYAEVEGQVDQDNGIGGSRMSEKSFPRMIRDWLSHVCAVCAKSNFKPGGWRCLTFESLGLIVVGVTLSGSTSQSAAVIGGILTACVAVVVFSLALALTVVLHAVGDLKTDLTTLLRIGAMFGHHEISSTAPRRTGQ
jgi:hypothetical protein